MTSSEPARIAEQMRRAFEGGAWHGPALREILADADAAAAQAKPLPDVHSIWEIVHHLTATQQILQRRLAGDGSALNLPVEVEWPAVVDTSEEAWRQALENLAEGERRLRDAISAFPTERLDQPLIPGGSDAYVNFHGHIQHNLYHAAQIGLLKILVKNSPA